MYNNEPHEWGKYVPLAKFSHNIQHHSSIKMSPFMALMGYKPRAIPAAIPETRIPGVEARIKSLQGIRDEAAAAHELSRLRMADYITKKFEPFKLGQKVWLEAKNLKINTPS